MGFEVDFGVFLSLWFRFCFLVMLCDWDLVVGIGVFYVDLCG